VTILAMLAAIYLVVLSGFRTWIVAAVLALFHQ
jgi:hypothetical protein